MKTRYAYSDERDKCYGVAGMVISLDVFDNDTMIYAVDIDDADGNYITFTPDFYFNSNPRFSARTSWNEMIKQYHLFTALVMGNVLCRQLAGKRKSLTRELIDEIHALIMDDGHDNALEDDEIDMVFNKTFNYLSHAFNNRQVYAIADGLVDIFTHQRQISGNDLIDQMQYLRRK